MPVSLHKLFHLASLATLAIASPLLAPVNTVLGQVAPSGKAPIATGTAIEPPQVTQKLEVRDSFMTVKVENRYGGDIVTRHVNGWGAPTPFGNPGQGVIPSRQTRTFVVPNGWNGNVAINDHRNRVDTGDESLIEGSFVSQGNGGPQSDINVSFVNGFSVPIVCRCDQNGVYTGCNKDLYKFNPCPNYNYQNACRNPRRFEEWNLSATPFFQPCKFPGGAYTYPKDNDANNLNQSCTRNSFTCCVGTACPR